MVQDNREAYVDPAFEFDAPQYWDFNTMEPDSPSATDIWFDTAGPRGLASPTSAVCKPEEKAENKHNDKAPVTVASITDQKEGVTTDESREAAATAVVLEAETLQQIEKIVQEAKTDGAPSADSQPQKPSNLVTSWSRGPATRVAINTGDAEANILQTADALAQMKKKEGFVVACEPRPANPAAPQQDKRKGCEGPPSLQQPPRAADTKRALEAFDKFPGQKGSKRQRMLVSAASSVGFVEGRNETARCTRTGKAGAPDLATDARTRKSQFKSREEMEEEEMAAMPKFKARPYNLRSGRGDSRMSLASTTSRHTACFQSQEEHAAKFKARPLDPRILQGPTFIPQLSHREPVMPHAPKLATDARLRCQKPAEATSSAFVFTSAGDLSRKKAQHCGVTGAAQFNLATEARGQAAQSAHQEALRKLEEESRRQRQFHAQPLPRTTKSGVAFAPVVSPILTMPEPFKLESEKRHEEARILREMLNQQALEREREQPKFKAQPVFKGKPFVPAKSRRLLTVPEGVELPGDKRSQQRAEFDAAVAERERKRQVEKLAAEAEQRLREEQEVKELRKGLHFKARPMPHYKTGFAEVQLPPPQWTDPVSPKLATEARAAFRAQHLSP